MRYSILLFIALVFSCQPKYDVPVTIELNSNWQFKKVSDTMWYSASVPGNIFSDVVNHKLIEDPFIGDNEKDVQWVSEEDWEYKTTFSVDEKTLEQKHLELNFEGLDTYASVYLNDSLILKANNAFRPWAVGVKPILKLENELRIVFEHTSKYEEAEKAKLPYELPEGNRIFTRKAQFQYGWDWGPKLNTFGIWRPIQLISWNDYKIDDIVIQNQTISDTISTFKINITDARGELKSLKYETYVNGKLNVVIPEKPKIPISIKNPKLWWPHNLGDPYLYNIKVIVKDGNRILDTVSKKIGIRNIDLVTEKDSLGESFYFKVNDMPVYTKGANYIPQHSFQNEVNDAYYEKLLNDVVDANMNMLRVWGGGIYENDIFYDLCDEKGIMVWQDFMFACAMYPGDDKFLENVKKEAEYNVKRLRNHPSIALWCGNNENSEGWHRWGWQANRSEAEKEEIWNNYLKVFDSILPNTVSRDTDTDYWESSPKYGRGNPKYEFEGDAHDWWIWHDAYPFEHLEEKVPRFMSEFGFQSFPSYEAIRYINQSDSIEISSEGFKNHQKHSRGFQLIEDYMQRDFPVPEAAEDYVYMSQVLQAYGITKGIEAQRRAKPYNMGTLYWQLNDCWPAVSWSSLDFMGNWKALHYRAKHSFEDVLVSSKIENNTLMTWVVNDDRIPATGNLSLQIIDFSGNILWESKQEITATPLSSNVKHSLDLDVIDFKKEASVLVSKFNNQTSFFFFTKPKDLKLNDSEIKRSIQKTESGFTIELTSDTFQKDVFLYTDAIGHFSDNFFNMLPNRTYKIEFNSEAEAIKDLKLKSLNHFLR
ncbi:MAG: glycoside hydrolase family 2 protein [Winogradskyella sp.]|uniref:beta-mannosidase n=1 Tax=Winogradskyella sp. TaxID=1883156 RepID=UPI000F3F896B|nr:glycoside hydrolase family 2 protein [Winogradskyella sp.]RNC88432.1 MAG: glycoside hydrolase family 2 protein [Winogradskyella sp.]